MSGKAKEMKKGGVPGVCPGCGYTPERPHAIACPRCGAVIPGAMGCSGCGACGRG